MNSGVDYRTETPYKLYIHIVPKKITGYDHDKYYVGITRQKSVKLRWNNGNGYRKNIHFGERYKNMDGIILNTKLLLQI